MAMPGDIFSCMTMGAVSIDWAEAKDATKHAIMHRTATRSKALYGPKCQEV